jgi:hypothetical protein
MVFGDDFAELVGAGATRVGWMNGALADPGGGDGAHKPGEVTVNKALGHSVWTPPPGPGLAAARRVEAAKYSAASIVRVYLVDETRCLLQRLKASAFQHSKNTNALSGSRWRKKALNTTTRQA